jgi:hypothetical protein
MFKINDRVYVIGHDLEGKIVDLEVDRDGRTWYYVREFAHPHLMVWVDHIDVDRPRGKRHDPKAE